MRVIEIDVTPSVTPIHVRPKWYQRWRFMQWIRHNLGRCEGTEMVMGFECPLCYEEACRMHSGSDRCCGGS